MQGLTAPFAPCDMGHYCIGGATVGSPSFSNSVGEQFHGDICPTGSYCPNGTVIPVPCPPGTYSPLSGNQDISDCIACDVGFFCLGGLAVVSGRCASGYHCSVAGQSRADPPLLACSSGYYCPAGTTAPLTCPPGTYQSATAQSSCLACPAGHFCDSGLYGGVSDYSLYPCPQGYYCPNGTLAATQFPCPPGTFNNRSGATTQAQCLPCTPGYYCSQYALTSAEGQCEAGYFCIGGANISRPVDGSTGDICPVGAYCPAGAAIWRACPLGSFSVMSGSVSVSDCEPCEAGKYCPEGRYAYDCDAGYVCVAGATTPRPLAVTLDVARNISIGGYICPAGAYCPEGSAYELLCVPGSYSPSPGAAVCADCPSGRLCPVDATVVPSGCPTGFYCPTRSFIESPCPQGTFSAATNLSDASGCQACSSGSYCATTGLSAPTGPCRAGFLCVAGSTTASPLSVALLTNVDCSDLIFAQVEILKDGILANVTSGSCPAGHYCPAGTTQPVPCPAGFYLPTLHGASVGDCRSCTAGSFCNMSGLSRVSGQCQLGFFCPTSSNVTVSNPSLYPCPVGSYCPTGSAAPLPCDDGQYQARTSQGRCDTCPRGFQCLRGTNSTIDPTPCPLGFVCLAGSGPMVSPCLPGTYSNATGLAAFDECLNCPAGSWCVNGSVAGICSSGYICLSGSATDQPNGTSPTQGRPCDAGFYCPAGALDPVACPNGTIVYTGFSTVIDLALGSYGINYSKPMLATGASTVATCQQCPPGFLCVDSILLECPVGFYCPVGSSEPHPCPTGLVSSSSRAAAPTDCLPCPAGKYCIYNASSRRTAFDCTVGHYCPEGTITPLECPIGTFRPTTGAANVSDCHTCSGGYYCPANATITPTLCPGAFFCPAGTSAPIPCQAGYYCPAGSPSAISCPGGYYCPSGLLDPFVCPPGHYCDGNASGTANTTIGAITPILCPLGYRDLDYAANYTRYRLTDACAKCPPGKYGNHPQRALCFDCEPGYVCLEGATLGNPDANRNLTVNGVPVVGVFCAPYDAVGDNASYFGYPNTLSYPCPPGYYCPLQSGTPQPCPVGTFRASTHGTELTDCLPCPSNTFNAYTGQVACEACGQSSAAGAGWATCRCKGANREFNPTGKQCYCKAQYGAREGSTLLRGSQDGTTDCQPLVYDNCAEGSTRNMVGDCLSAGQWYSYCLGKCPSGVANPYYQSDLGVCLCLAQPLESVCDLDCQRQEQNMQPIRCSNPPTIAITNAAGVTTVEQTTEAFPSLYDVGTAACGGHYDGRTVSSFFMTSSSAGFSGVYRSTNATATSQRRRRGSGSVDDDSLFHLLDRSRRASNLSLTTIDYTASASVANPVACLELNQVVVFVVSGTHYPIYDKDNLLNRQDDSSRPFDQTPFLNLQSSLSQLQVNFTVFAYAFTSPGVAVLVDSTSQLPTVFAVMGANTACPAMGPFFPPTASAYHTMGIAQTKGLLQSPDWALVGYITGGGVSLILLLVLVLLVFRRKGWTKQQFTHPAYRQQAQQASFDEFASKGSQLETAQKLNPAALAVTGGGAAATALPMAATVVGSPITVASPGGVSASSDAAFREASDEFWDYERQVDLEAFDVNRFFGVLDQHSSTVKAALAAHKEQIEDLYKKSTSQTAALKSLWSSKLNLKSRVRLLPASVEDTLNYTKRMAEIDKEMGRRRKFAEFFGAILSEQRSLALAFYRDTVAYSTFVDSTTENFVQHCRWLVEHKHHPIGAMFHDKMATLAALLKALETAHEQECLRRGALCALVPAQSLGGKLVAPGQTSPVPLSRLMVAGHLFESDLLSCDPLTNLFLPRKGVQMLLANDALVDIPPGHFVHPNTGRVLPIEGSVAYNTLAGRLVVLVDNTGYLSYVDLIPYVPFPESAANNTLKALPPGTKLSYGMTYTDPVHGQPVKLLACTIDSAGAVLPVGGTYLHPLTNLRTPIDLGLPMLDVNSAICPIVGVSISPASGDVVPVGGFSNGKSLGSQVSLVDPLYSLTPLQASGARLDSNTNAAFIVASGRTCLDNMELSKELESIDAIREFVGALSEFTSEEVLRKSLAQLQLKLEAVSREVGRVRSQSHAVSLARLADLMLHLSHVAEIVKHGGSLGEVVHPHTGDVVHLLPGMELVELETNLSVPILGALIEDDDTVLPLAGTMDNIEGLRVPIDIGAQFIEPGTERFRHVAGATVDPETHDVLPAAVPCWPRRPRAPWLSSLLEMLDEEIVARKSHRRRHRTTDDDTMASVFRLGVLMLSDAEELSSHDITAEAAVLQSVCEARRQGLVRERARREEFAAAQFPTDVVELLAMFDKREDSVEDEMMAGYVRAAELASGYVAEIQAVDKRFERQLAESEEKAALMETFRTELNVVTGALAAKFKSMSQNLLRLRSESHQLGEVFTALAGQARVVLLFYMRVNLAGSAKKRSGRVNDVLRELLVTLKNGPDAATSLLAGAGVGMGMGAGSGAQHDPAAVPGRMRMMAVPSEQRLGSTNLPVTSAIMVGAETVGASSFSSSTRTHDSFGGPDGALSGAASEDERSQSAGPGASDPLSPATTEDPMSQFASQQSSRSGLFDDLRPETRADTRNSEDADGDRDRPMLQRSLSTLSYRPGTRGSVRLTHLEMYAVDVTRMETELREKERAQLGAVFEASEQQRHAVMQSLAQQLVLDLAAGTDKDQQRAVQEYEANVASMIAVVDANEQRQLGAVLEQLAEERVAEQTEILMQSREAPEDEERPTVDRARDELALLAQQIAEFQRTLAAVEYVEEDAGSRDATMQRLADSINSSRGGTVATASGTILKPSQEVAAIAQQERVLADRSNAVKERIARRKAERLQAVQLDESLTPQEKQQRMQMIEAAACVQQGALAAAVVANRTQALQQLQSKLGDQPAAAAVQQLIRESVEGAASHANAERQRQRDLLKAKLAARQRLLEARAPVAEETGGEGVHSGDGTRSIVGGTEADAEAAAAAALTRQLEEQYLARQTEIEMKKQERLREVQTRLEAELAQLEKEERSALEAVAEREAAAKLRERKSQFEQDTEAQRAQMTDAEYRRLLAEHEQQNASLSSLLDKEKRDQMSQLQERLQERRRRKEVQLKASATLEASQDQLAEDKKLVQGTQAEKSQAENTALVTDYAETNDTAAVVKALQKRHAFEMAQRAQLLEKEKNLVRDRALAEFEAGRDQERDALLQRQSEELVRLVGQMGDGKEAELGQRKAQLRKDHKKQLVAFDSMTDDLREWAIKDAVVPVEVAQKEEQQRMKEAQYRELSDVLRQCSPEHALVKQYEDASQQARRRADDYKRKLEGDGRARLEKERAHRIEKDKAKKKELEDKVERKKAEVAEEQAKRERQALEAKKNQQLREKEEELSRRLAEADETQRKLLMDQHRRDVDAINSFYDAQRKKQNDMLDKRLAERREARQKRQQARADAAAAAVASVPKLRVIEDPAGDQSDAPPSPISIVIQRPSEPDVRPMVEALGLFSSPSALLHRRASVASSGAAAAAVLSEEQLAQVMLRSPYAQLFRKITDIERLIQSGAVAAQPAAAAVFVDEEDRKWDRSTAQAVVAADIATLSPMQFALYRFGVFVTRLLVSRCGCPKVSVLLAHDFPPSPERPNAFRNSYCYEPASRVLFVRTARLRHVGDLALVVTHALAHIKCGDMDDDRNTAFVFEFYSCLRAICQDLFMARARSDGAAAMPTSHPMHAQFAKATPDEKIALVNTAVDLAVDSPVLASAARARYGGVLSAAQLQATVASPASSASASAETFGAPHTALAADAQLLSLVATARQELDVGTADPARQALADRRKMLEAQLEPSKAKGD